MNHHWDDQSQEEQSMLGSLKTFDRFSPPPWTFTSEWGVMAALWAYSKICLPCRPTHVDRCSVFYLFYSFYLESFISLALVLFCCACISDKTKAMEPILILFMLFHQPTALTNKLIYLTTKITTLTWSPFRGTVWETLSHHDLKKKRM